MKTKSLLTSLFILVGLVATSGVTYALARFLPTPVLVAATPGLPPLTGLDLPSQTQNGYTATLESYYADATRILFQVRITGGQGMIGNIILNDENGDFINASTGWGPVTGSTSALSQIEFNTLTPLPGDHLKGQLQFAVVTSPGGMDTLANFQFDFEIPIHPAQTFYPKQTIAANGVEIMLDRIIITPAFTQAYLCYIKPTPADWVIGGTSALEVNGQQSAVMSYGLLYDAAYSDGAKGGEPGWTPPIKDGRCVKLGFPVGAEHPQTVTLTIPALEQSMPEVISQDELDAAYPKLLAQGIDMVWHTEGHGAYPEYKKLPAGMTEQEAMRKFIETLGYVYSGPWEFSVALNP